MLSNLLFSAGLLEAPLFADDPLTQGGDPSTFSGDIAFIS